MTDDPRGDILLAGLDGPVSLAETLSFVGDMALDASDEQLRRITTALLIDTTRQGLIVPGDLRPRFVPWSDDVDTMIERLRGPWPALPSALTPAHGWWIILTQDGERAGRRLWTEIVDHDDEDTDP